MDDVKLSYVSPWARMRRLANKEVRGQLSPGELAEFRDPKNALLRFRVLWHMRRETESATAEQRKYLRSLVPLPGELPSEEYLKAKAEQAVREGRRLKFLRHLDQLIAEAKSEVATQGVTRTTLADVIESLLEVRMLLARGEVDGAERLLDSLTQAFWRQVEEVNDDL